ncbi:MAG: DHHA1 domain-containing protein [Collinsella aerofaciens]
MVTDHHEPLRPGAAGCAPTDPKLEDEGPSRELPVLVWRSSWCKSWVSAWQAVVLAFANRGRALGTVSDMMPLTPENRALVAEGIQQMRVTARPGYIALAALAKADLSSITADGLSFSLIPRLNAAGRMADPKLALDLLLARDPIEASALAAELEEINRQRREIEAELTRDAMAKVEETYDGGRAIVVGGEGWHEGVKGIVASRLTNRYHVPALLFSIEDGIARGSGRSVGKVTLFDAVDAVPTC